MTKKHYIAIAAIIAAGEPLHGKDEKETKALQAYREIIAGELADYFATDNPRFNRTRFLQACGIETKGQCEQTPCWCNQCK